MEIQEALLLSKKVRKLDNDAEYATLIEDLNAGGREHLSWYGVIDEPVHYTEIMEDDWEPVYEEKEKDLEKPFIELEDIQFNFLAGTDKVYIKDYDKVKDLEILGTPFTMRLYKKKG